MNQAGECNGLRSWCSLRNVAVPLVAGLMLTVFTGPAMPVSANGPALQECTPGVVVTPDADNDGVTDDDEVLYGTDPNNADMDDDGLTDYDELFCTNSSAGVADTDGDGLDDYLEWAWGADPNVADTDGDDLLDADEVLIYGTFPTKGDTDDDGISDMEEIVNTGTDPMLFDTDDDGLIDGDEIWIYGTLPSDSDTDDDGIVDGDEIVKSGTDPLASDTDEDGALDGEEIAFGSSPLDGSDFPAVQAGPEKDETGSDTSAAVAASDDDTESVDSGDIAGVTTLPTTGAGVAPAESTSWVAAVIALLTGALALTGAHLRRRVS